jgi:tripartite-type tricarboxylate transporter receptor subunit TctC
MTAASLSPAAPAGAAGYPEKPVTVIVPYLAGGAADLIARHIADGVKPFLPQPMVVVNRPGGGGTIAASEVVRGRPDGYTVGFMTAGIMTFQPHRVALSYDKPSEYDPVIEVANVPLVWAVRADSPWKTFKDLLGDAAKSPGKFRVGTPGVGSMSHLGLEVVKMNSHVDLTHVPFAGNAESVPALLGGHVEVVILNPADVIPHMKAGKVRIIATTDPKRSPLYPDVPTLTELGMAEGSFGVPYLFITPKSTPANVEQVLHDAIKRVVDGEGFKKLSQEAAFLVEYRGPAELRRMLEQNYETFGALAERLKLKK